MKREMKKYGLPEPEFYEERDSFKVVFRNQNVVHETQDGTQSGQQTGQQSRQQTTIEDNKLKILEYCEEAKTSKQIKEYLNIKSRQYISTYLINPLIKEGKLNYTNKNSINAKNQKYITVKK